MEPNIYFKNIDYDYTEKDISQIFSYIGNIKSLYIVRDSKGRSRGFGFMSYFTLEHAQRAVEEINGKFLGRKPVIVMFHIRKEERRMMKTSTENMGVGDIGSYYQGEPSKPGKYITLKNCNFSDNRFCFLFLFPSYLRPNLV